MRTNAFGENYYAPEDDLGLDDGLQELDGDFCAEVFPPEGDDGWGAEFRDNNTGDTVCHLEGFASREAIERHIRSYFRDIEIECFD